MIRVAPQNQHLHVRPNRRVFQPRGLFLLDVCQRAPNCLKSWIGTLLPPPAATLKGRRRGSSETVHWKC